MTWLSANAFELIAVIVTAISIWLATKQNIWYYPTGLVSLAMYTWLFYAAKLYAESLLQIVWLALMLYGWYEWLHGGANRTELPVTRTPRWGWAAAIVAGVAGTAIVIALQVRYTDNPAPYVDSSITVWSMIAQWFTARKWIESWILWIVVNTLAVPLYISRDYRLTAVLYTVLWFLAIAGYVKWRRTLVAASA